MKSIKKLSAVAGATVVLGLAVASPASASTTTNWGCTRDYVCLFDYLNGGGGSYGASGDVAECINIGAQGWGDRAESWNKMWPTRYPVILLNWTGQSWQYVASKEANETGNWDLPEYARNTVDAIDVGGVC
jgi:hypothetical protein